MDGRLSKQKRKYSSNLIIGLFVTAFFLSSCWYFILSGPFNRLQYVPNEIEHNRIQEQLTQAKKRWQDQNIQSYDVDVKINNDFVSCMDSKSARLNADVTLKVRDGEVVDVLKRKEEIEVPLRCPYYSSYTIPKILKEVDSYFLKIKPEAWLQVSFDQQYGFVSYLESDCSECGNIHRAIAYSNFRTVESGK